MNDKQIFHRIAGCGALVSGCAGLVGFAAHGLTRGWGGFGFATPNIGPIDAPAVLIAFWGLGLIPAAMALFLRYEPEGPLTALASVACGIASLLLWTMGSVTAETRVLDLLFLGFATVWWLGTGWLTLGRRGAFAPFTMLLGVMAAAAAVDELVKYRTGLTLVPPLLRIALCLAWSFWLGTLILRGEIAWTPPLEKDREAA